MILPKTTIHLTGKLIKGDVKKILTEKIRMFKKHGLRDASFSEQVGVMVDYSFVTTEKKCGGYCDYVNGIIALNDSSSEEYKNKTIFHEIGHAIQAQAGLFNGEIELLSNSLKLEWQAESIAFVFYNSIYKPKPHYTFDSYFNDEDVDYLKNWYGDWVQNDTEEHKGIIV